ncbi:MAG: type II toxin-antitoxin system prevent-host-death family antitoxin [Microbacteriaceae bacterium]
MEVVNVYDAKSSLSRLLARAERGESIVIARNGRPIAHLGPVPGAARERVPGALKGRIEVGEDFDLDEAEIEEWLGV